MREYNEGENWKTKNGTDERYYRASEITSLIIFENHFRFKGRTVAAVEFINSAIVQSSTHQPAHPPAISE